MSVFVLQEIAELLATRAQEVGQLSSVRSPFADEAQAAGYVAYRGGKLGDVSCDCYCVVGEKEIQQSCTVSLVSLP